VNLFTKWVESADKDREVEFYGRENQGPS